jgi:hypothetical protein
MMSNKAPMTREEEILSYAGKVYPGFEGIPFRASSAAPPPDLKADDPRQPVLVVDAKVRVLDLTDTEDLRLYEFIWDQVAKGRFIQPVEERQYDVELKGWRVFIRFGVRWLEMPAR